MIRVKSVDILGRIDSIIQLNMNDDEMRVKWQCRNEPSSNEDNRNRFAGDRKTGHKT